MKHMLIILLVLTGVTLLVSSVERKYFLIQQTKTWNDAQTYCRSTYTDLATIETSADVVKLQAEAQKYQFNSEAWIGAYKFSHSWRWSYQSVQLGATTFWSPGEPDNAGNKQECVLIDGLGSWEDECCAWSLPFLCYDETKTGNARYIYVSTPADWRKARNYCRQYYTDLASARDATENSLIYDMLKAKSSTSVNTWIGLYRITWKWLDVNNKANISFMPGQPDNFYGNEDCVLVSNFLAADAQCSELKAFFCHSSTTGQIQSLRLKVESNQNMNEIAVKAALLEKIQQKLKEHGMEQNVTLKWRAKPGDVFQKI